MFEYLSKFYLIKAFSDISNAQRWEKEEGSGGGGRRKSFI